LEREKSITTFYGHETNVKSCSLSKDSRFIVSSDENGSLKLWDAVNSMLIQTLNNHYNCINKVRLSPDGNCFASCSSDHKIYLYDLRYHSRILQQYSNHETSVNCIDFHPTGNYLISGANDNCIKIWNLMSCELLYTIDTGDSPVCSLKFSTCG
jgi:WD40 repeat protein